MVTKLTVVLWPRPTTEAAVDPTFGFSSRIFPYARTITKYVCFDGLLEHESNHLIHVMGKSSCPLGLL